MACPSPLEANHIEACDASTVSRECDSELHQNVECPLGLSLCYVTFRVPIRMSSMHHTPRPPYIWLRD